MADVEIYWISGKDNSVNITKNLSGLVFHKYPDFLMYDYVPITSSNAHDSNHKRQRNKLHEKIFLNIFLFIKIIRDDIISSMLLQEFLHSRGVVIVEH